MIGIDAPVGPGRAGESARRCQPEATDGCSKPARRQRRASALTCLDSAFMGIDQLKPPLRQHQVSVLARIAGATMGAAS